MLFDARVEECRRSVVGFLRDERVEECREPMLPCLALPRRRRGWRGGLPCISSVHLRGGGKKCFVPALNSTKPNLDVRKHTVVRR